MSPIKTMHLAVVSLWAEDLPPTVHFYRDLIGLPLLPDHSHRAAFDLGGGAHLLLLQGRPVPAQNAEPALFPLVAMAVENLDEAVEHLEAHGVELIGGVQDGREARWVIFRDPAGNLVELAQFKPAHPA